MKKSQIVLALVLLLTNSCKEDPLPTKGNIAGRITEEGTNNPIPAATIYITGAEQSYTTGEDGTYKINDLYADDYSVNVSKLGYITDTKILTVVPEKTTPGDFILKMDLPKATPTSIILTYDKTSESIELENTRSGEMPFTTETSKTWLKVSPETGSIQSLNKKIITITADLTNVPFANYDEIVLINVGSASLSIPVQITYEQPPYIDIEKPVADETYKMGEIMPILWNSNLTGKVRIDLIRYSSIYLQIKKEVTNENGGNFSWQIPVFDTSNYQIKISSVENENISATSGSFKLISGATAPSVLTKNIIELNSTNFKIGGEITHIGLEASKVTQYGHVYSTSNKNPTIADYSTKLGSTTETLTYTSTISAIEPKKTIYVAAYATNSIGTAYGEVLTITTPSSSPIVETVEITDITTNMVKAKGEVISNGGETLNEKGFCYNTNSPVLVEHNVVKTTDTTIGAYSLIIDNLTPSTKYYIKAYAKNSLVPYLSNSCFFWHNINNNMPELLPVL